MLKPVSTGLCILVVVVFAYVGYSSYATRKSAPNGSVYADGMQGGGRAKSDAKAEQTGAGAGATSFPAMSPTGDSNGQVAQRGDGAEAGGMPAPATDSIAPNPPNGMTFGGSGHFQLYRQGDLTWRLNTDNGETCVIFATDEEWRKPKVFKAGCRGR